MPSSLDTAPRWEVVGNELMLHRNGVLEAISAKRLFSHLFIEPDAELPTLRAIDSSILGVTYSRIPVSIWIDAGFIAESLSSPECRVVVEDQRRHFSIDLGDISARRSDHIVHQAQWHPFTPGSFDDVKANLATAGITKPGSITLRQLLNLRELSHKHPHSHVRLQTAPHGEVRLTAPQVRVELSATLYPYQERGVSWLLALANEQLGGILADEMGLGKTIQVIGLLASHQEATPALVVAPATLLENWRREIARFAAQLCTLIHYGAARTGFPSELRAHDVVVVSYETLIRDLSLIEMVRWGAVVLDEAQNIRNPDALRTAAVKRVPRRVSIAVTGTPVENRLEDLWSLCDFAVPGFLPKRGDFLKEFEDTPAGAARLAAIAGPFILRRRISDVAGDLPPRIDIPQALKLSDWLADEYERLRQRIIAEYGPAAGFAGLTSLRQFCTHPFLISEVAGDPAAYSPKYVRLTDIIIEILSNNEKALLFTSFSKMIDLLLSDLPRRLDVPCTAIDGRTNVVDRQVLVDDFTDAKEARVMILNPRAGGTGLNIAAANHVIHLNPEWNPATQDQASARAHRRGQTRPVTVHQLYYLETVEEVIMERLDRKREIASSAIPPESAAADRADILRALGLSPRYLSKPDN